MKNANQGIFKEEKGDQEQDRTVDMLLPDNNIIPLKSMNFLLTQGL